MNKKNTYQNLYNTLNTTWYRKKKWTRTRYGNKNCGLFERKQEKVCMEIKDTGNKMKKNIGSLELASRPH